MKIPKINTIQLSIVMISLVLLAFAGVQFQANNRKMDIQERQAFDDERTESSRKSSLALCLSLADDDYFNYAKLNGTINADGSIRASAYVWSKAQEDKDADVKICELKFGK